MDNVTANQKNWDIDNQKNWDIDNQTNSDIDSQKNWDTFGIQIGNIDPYIDIGLVSLIWLVSLIGNGIIFAVVMSKRKSGISTTYFFFGTLSVLDMLVTSIPFLTLFINLGEVWLHRLRNLFLLTCMDLSAWTLVLISMERLASVVIPLKVKDVVTTKRAIIAEIVMASLIIAMDYFIWLHSAVVLIENADQIEHEYHNITRVFVLFLMFTPFVVISVSSIIIGVKIRTSIGKNEDLINSVTRNLLAINVAYIITQFPYIIFIIYVESIKFLTVNQSLLMIENGLLILYWTGIIKVSNHAINCLAYVLSGRTFRDDVRNMICRQRNVR